jgi:hypothetical protein
MSNLKELAMQPSEDSRSWQNPVDNKTMAVSKSVENHEPGNFDESQLFDLQMLGQGDQIQVCEDGTLPYSGVVDTSAPSLGIIWIRLEGLGERKLIFCTDYRLRRDRTKQWDLTVLPSGE